MILYDYNTGNRPELKIDDVYAAISLYGQYEDMFKDAALLSW